MFLIIKKKILFLFTILSKFLKENKIMMSSILLNFKPTRITLYSMPLSPSSEVFIIPSL